MFNIFREKIISGISERLSSSKFRYVDNSLNYYNNPVRENSREDKEWFLKNKIPDVQIFLHDNMQYIDAHVLSKGLLYNLLADRHSRETLVLVTLYAILGRRFVKFPYYAENAIQLRRQLAQTYAVSDPDVDMERSMARGFADLGPLFRYAVPVAGESIELYANPEFLYQLAAFPPYCYASDTTRVEVNRNDFILDCGSCYGDTALMFAAKTGAQGKVLSFEPHPEISRLFLYNRSLNPCLAERMFFVPAATSDTDQGEITLNLCGAGSHTGEGLATKRHAHVPQTTLDKEIARRHWERVDFIKMDVEGAELATLHGAKNILRCFRPKLAICLYHKMEDFLTIPKFLYDMDLQYKFYLEHHFVNNWETVLYAYPIKE